MRVGGEPARSALPADDERRPRLLASVVVVCSRHQHRVELVLHDKLAEAITEKRLTVAPGANVQSSFSILARACSAIELGRSGADLFDRTQANPIGLAESAIDCSGFRNPHFGATN